jgi:hypothetical protein
VKKLGQQPIRIRLATSLSSSPAALQISASAYVGEEAPRWGGSGRASRSKKPCVSSATSYTESLRSKLRPDASILSSLHDLISKSKTAVKDLTDLDPSADPASSYIVVADQDTTPVTSCINRLVLTAACSILSGQGFSFAVPSYAASNQVYGSSCGGSRWS